MTNTTRQAANVMSSLDQAACQPWEMTSFDVHLHPAKNAGHGAVVLPTIEQITAIQEQARQEGYLAGHAEGLVAGREVAAREAARLHDLAEVFSTEVALADETISQHILDLSVDLARALLKSALTIRPELVLPIVQEAVRYLPAVHQPALLFLNPADALLVKEKIGDELEKMGWQVAGDGQLEPGGCRVETASNQIDASLPTRWQRLTAALSKNSDWLAD
ncbi:flagellar assembly protein FliH [Thiobacillus sp.]